MNDSIGTGSVEFSHFVASLGSAVMLHLGKMPDPTGAPVNINLDLARHSIDTLAMLKAKTHGNLTAEESQLLERLLHDTRMMWLEESRKNAS
ncbi:MAG TPA: DUF1844 domain-containing protein [Myxococcales bacterium]|nr:hypothetical protein [Myxococcales bacterium]HAN31116.1 DUF1844 domain-containing protein [Myxococcales bacterium]